MILGLPWWCWVLLFVGVLTVIFYGALAGFRRNIRKELIAWLLEQYPGTVLLEERASFMRVQHPESGEMTVYFRRLYNAVSMLKENTETARREVYRQFFGDALAQFRELNEPLSLSKHSMRIFPRIQPAEALGELEKRESLPHRRLGDTDLVVVYVIDFAQSVAYLTDGQLKELGITEEDLYALAVQNLAQSFKPEVVRRCIENKTMIRLALFDSYDAARLLLVGQHLQDGECLLAAIPDRDTLVILPFPQDGNPAPFKEIARASLSDRRISDQLLKVTNRTIVTAV